MRVLKNEEIKRAAYERNLLFGENDVFAHTRKSDADQCIAKAQHKLDIEKFIGWCEEHHCGHPDGVIPEVPLEISYADWQEFKQLVEK